MSIATARELGDHTMGMGTRDFPAPASIKLRLFRTPPADDGTGGVEASYAGYAPVTTGATDWNVATSSGLVTNKVKLAFPKATGSEGAALTHMGLFDPGDGLVFVHPLLDQTKQPIAGDTPEFAIEDIDLDWNANATGLSNHLSAELGDHVMGMGTRDYPSPSQIYAHGYTTAPSDADAGGVLANYTGYAGILTSASTWSVADANALINNLLELAWPKATTDEGQDWVAIALRDHATAGNLLIHGALAGAFQKEPKSSDTPVIRIGKLVLDWNAN